MPELAEVEYYRRQWDAGLRQPIRKIELHRPVRIFRNVPVEEMERVLTGAVLVDSAAHGKRMIFRFSNAWLGIHLGMTGKLRVEPPDSRAGKHDHLRLIQDGRVLVLSDPRQFGRVQFHRGTQAPGWWKRLPPAIGSAGFTARRVEDFLGRHRRAPIKAVLLSQNGFPGVGNWMADEILWRAGIHPARLAGALSAAERGRLFRETKFVCRGALRTIAEDFRDPPAHWLIHQRWSKGGQCSRDGTPLQRRSIAGRTTCWCPVCQKGGLKNYGERMR